MAGFMDALKNRLLAKTMAAQNPPPEPAPASPGSHRMPDGSMMSGSSMPAAAPIAAPATPDRDIFATIREGIVPFRNRAAEAMLQPGGMGTHDSAKERFHVGGSRALTEGLGSVLPAEQAGQVADALYMGNEAMSGVLAKASGLVSGDDKPFFSPYGFNTADLFLNRRGQQQGIRNLRARAEEEKASGAETTRRLNENRTMATLRAALNSMFSRPQ